MGRDLRREVGRVRCEDARAIAGPRAVEPAPREACPSTAWRRSRSPSPDTAFPWSARGRGAGAQKALVRRLASQGIDEAGRILESRDARPAAWTRGCSRNGKCEGALFPLAEDRSSLLRWLFPGRRRPVSSKERRPGNEVDIRREGGPGRGCDEASLNRRMLSRNPTRSSWPTSAARCFPSSSGSARSTPGSGLVSFDAPPTYREGPPPGPPRGPERGGRPLRPHPRRRVPGHGSVQYEIVFFLAEDPGPAPRAMPSGAALAPGKLFIVGDAKQSIYRFRGADIGAYERADEIVRGSEAGPFTVRKFPEPAGPVEPINDLFEDFVPGGVPECSARIAPYTGRSRERGRARDRDLTVGKEPGLERTRDGRRRRGQSRRGYGRRSTREAGKDVAILSASGRARHAPRALRDWGVAFVTEGGRASTPDTRCRSSWPSSASSRIPPIPSPSSRSSARPRRRPGQGTPALCGSGTGRKGAVWSIDAEPDRKTSRSSRGRSTSSARIARPARGSPSTGLPGRSSRRPPFGSPWPRPTRAPSAPRTWKRPHGASRPRPRREANSAEILERIVEEEALRGGPRRQPPRGRGDQCGAGPHGAHGEGARMGDGHRPRPVRRKGPRIGAVDLAGTTRRRRAGKGSRRARGPHGGGCGTPAYVALEPPRSSGGRPRRSASSMWPSRGRRSGSSSSSGPPRGAAGIWIPPLNAWGYAYDPNAGFPAMELLHDGKVERALPGSGTAAAGAWSRRAGSMDHRGGEALRQGLRERGLLGARLPIAERPRGGAGSRGGGDARAEVPGRRKEEQGNAEAGDCAGRGRCGAPPPRGVGWLRTRRGSRSGPRRPRARARGRDSIPRRSRRTSSASSAARGRPGFSIGSRGNRCSRARCRSSSRGRTGASTAGPWIACAARPESPGSWTSRRTPTSTSYLCPQLAISGEALEKGMGLRDPTRGRH